MAPQENYTPAVRRALEELERAFPDSAVIREQDGEGGAHVTVEDVPLGPPYRQTTTWVGFRLGFQYPYADVYPHFVRDDLTRLDGNALGAGLSAGRFREKPATQVSRRSNNLDATNQTAVLKLLKVLDWLRSR